MRIVKRIVLGLLILIVGFIVYIYFSIQISPPHQDLSVINKNLIRTEFPNGYKYGNNWLRKEGPGLYSMYVEGKSFERGYAMGILTKELANEQEEYFVNEVKKKIPSSISQFFLKIFVGWFNRNIDQHIPEEYQKEIYGISFFASDKFSYVGPAYQRLLNYHAAHDIGHAVQNMDLVACTALGAWDKFGLDNQMYVGRNFDFYVGDDFAKTKLIQFVNPDQGHKFVSLSWGGMIGVLSGMNDAGLTLTLNSDKSEIPSHTGTPVSLIAREILQYASTIDEAYAIAKKRSCFVAESFMIGSTKDKKVAIIEKTPEVTSIYYSAEPRIVCANHFQSKELKDTKINIENMQDSTSVYRYQRVEELMNDIPLMDEKKLAQLLRDKQGHGNKWIGMGNEKSINQLLAHHAIIFQPYQKNFWISTSPFNQGKFLALNLDDVFETSVKEYSTFKISDVSKEIPEDPFMHTDTFAYYLKFHELDNKLKNYLIYGNGNVELKEAFDVIKYNPDFYNGYVLAADYLDKKSNYVEALKLYKLALTKELGAVADRKRIQEKIANLEQKISAK